jgi:hypothetical protein
MRSLTASELLQVWEHGRDQGGVDRALTVLAAACGDRSLEQLARLPVGRRDALLLGVRAATLGPRLESLADCPACAAQLEFSLDTGEVRARIDAAEDRADQGPATYRLAADGLDLVYRLPDSLDLLALGSCPDAAGGRALLVRRCVLSARRDGQDVRPEELPAGALALVEAEMAGRDGGAEIDLDLTCEACGHAWRTSLDAAGFFWTEIDALATRLLSEVAALAQAYGWREADILAMSAARRQRYLELAGHG